VIYKGAGGTVEMALKVEFDGFESRVLIENL